MKQEDLFDPLNATKVEFCLLWGELTRFEWNPVIALSARHWGHGRIRNLIGAGVFPPKNFVKTTICLGH